MPKVIPLRPQLTNMDTPPNITQSKAHRHLVRAFEAKGTPRASAHIMALMLVCEREELSFDEIRQTLQMGKSTASAAIGRLVRMHILRQTKAEGSRRHYFHLQHFYEQSTFENLITHLQKFNRLIGQIAPDCTPARRRALAMEYRSNQLIIKRMAELMMELQTLQSHELADEEANQIIQQAQNR